MNRKTMKSILSRKFNDWLDHIDDEAVRNDVEENSIVTGGAIASMLQDEMPKDFDVYFTNKETTRRVADYYVNRFNDVVGDVRNKIGYKNKAFVLDGDVPLEAQLEKEGLHDWGSNMLRVIEPGQIKIIMRSDGVAGEDGVNLDEPFEDVYDVLEQADDIPAEMLDGEPKKKYRPVFLSPNAVTLSDKIQVIIRFYGTPDEIHDSYDFEHCKNYWLSDGGTLYLKQEALEAILMKRLVYTGSRYPVCSVIRTRKFIQRGWKINAGQILKMLFQISELDLTDLCVLEDQLVGVDTAYFMSLIESLRKKMENDEKFTLTNDYICSVIDKVFG